MSVPLIKVNHFGRAQKVCQSVRRSIHSSELMRGNSTPHEPYVSVRCPSLLSNRLAASIGQCAFICFGYYSSRAKNIQLIKGVEQGGAWLHEGMMSVGLGSSTTEHVHVGAL
jgi:hypothetical protein